MSLFLTNVVITWLHKSIHIHTCIYKIWWKEEIPRKVNHQRVALLVKRVRIHHAFEWCELKRGYSVLGISQVAKFKEKTKFQEKTKCEASSLRDFQKGGICKVCLLVQIYDEPNFISLFTY